jgi:UDP-GlcNAc:undecaprenyl-phosphate/decaprenyl-phosphate GlcNAc-1-phosphate transferase
VTRTLLAVGALLLGALTTRALLHRLIPTAPLTRRNYRGLAVPTGLGITLLAGLLAGAALVGFVHAIAPAERTPLFVNLAGMPALMIALGFGLLGLFDDLTSAAAPDAPRGLRGHLRALRAGQVTGGGIKMLGGIALSIVAGSLLATSFVWAVVNAAVIALTANLFNSLDVRPGRSLKAFLIAAVPLAVLGGTLRPLLAAAVGAAVAFLREDLRERAMLGDVGSNALGGLVGYGIVVLAPDWLVLSVLGLLAVLTVLAEGPTLSKGIAAFAPLRALDQAGRVPDVPSESPLHA